jgi:hypothetical protein
MALGAHALFRATKQRRPDMPREENDFYPTPPEVTRALLQCEGHRLKAFDGVWESAAGDGVMADIIEQDGHKVRRSDLIDRGCNADLVDYFRVSQAPYKAQVTNPPYCEINARDGKGRWLTHGFDIGCEYIALFLNWDWPAAKGLSHILERHPISRVYVCRWKVDFTGKGAPPQRNAWFVWDKDWSGETVLRFLDKSDGRQMEMFK